MAFKTEKDVLTMAQKDGQYWSDYDKERQDVTLMRGCPSTPQKRITSPPKPMQTRNTKTGKQRVSGAKMEDIPQVVTVPVL